MGQDVFLELGDSSIDGDATDSQHSGWIEVTSFSLNVDSKADKVPTEGERKVLKAATIEAVSISKKFDKSSAKILNLSLKKEAMDNPCKIHFCQPSGSLTSSKGLDEYMTFTLENATIQNYSLSAGGGYPTESFKIQFKTIVWQQKGEGGKESGGSYSRPLSDLKK